MCLGILRSATYLDSGQKAVEDTNAQSKGLREEVEQTNHLSQPQHQVVVLRLADVCTLQGGDRGRTTGQHRHLSHGAGAHHHDVLTKPPGVSGPADGA